MNMQNPAATAASNTPQRAGKVPGKGPGSKAPGSRQGGKLRPFTPRPKPALRMGDLRPWQQECLAQQLEAAAAGGSSFFTAAGVGSGKTIQACAFYLASDFDLLVVLTPRTGIRGSWQKDSARLGLELDDVISADGFRTASGYAMPHGFVLTTAMLPSVATDLANLCRRMRVMLVVDEAHHAGEGMQWTADIESALSGNKFLHCLSGTPFRSDDKRILGMHYTAAGRSLVGAPCYTRSYAQNLAAKEVAPVITSYVSGDVTLTEKVGKRVQSVTYDYEDGDYSFGRGAPDVKAMGKRLRLSAVESVDWQMGAIAAARQELVAMRSDGIPWGGLIVCATVQQAGTIATQIERRWGDRFKLIVADADTESSVSEFEADGAFMWAISITKVTEGVSINRLRVGVVLSNVTTQSAFEQIRGRLVRLLPGVDPLAQAARFYIPMDPRLVDYARQVDEIVLHTVPWLQGNDDATAQYAAAGVNTQLQGSRDASVFDALGVGVGVGAGAGAGVVKVKALLAALRGSLVAPSVVHAGSFTLTARPKVDGVAVQASDYEDDDTTTTARAKLESICNPLHVLRMSGPGALAFLAMLDGATPEDDPKAFIKAGKAIECGLAPRAVAGVSYDLAVHVWGLARVGGFDDYVKRPNGYWTLERLKASALKYASRKEWERGGGVAYDAAQRAGLLDACCGHMGEKLGETQEARTRKAATEAYRAERGIPPKRVKDEQLDTWDPEWRLRFSEGLHPRLHAALTLTHQVRQTHREVLDRAYRAALRQTGGNAVKTPAWLDAWCPTWRDAYAS